MFMTTKSSSRNAAAQAKKATMNGTIRVFISITPCNFSFYACTNHQKNARIKTSTMINKTGPAKGKRSFSSVFSAIRQLRGIQLVLIRINGRHDHCQVELRSIITGNPTGLSMAKPRKRIVDFVIFTGMAVNAVVIVLILYFFVF